MSSAAKYLLGGSDSKQQSTSVSTPIDLVPSEFSALRPQFAEQLSTQLASGGPQYSGPLVAPLGQAEADALTALRAEGGTRQGLLEQTLGGNFLPGGTQANPHLQAAIEAAQRSTLQGLEEVLGRTLPGRFTQAGGFIQPQGNSAFDRAAALATRGAANALGDIASNISFGAYNQERQLQQNAIQLSQQEVQTGIQKLQAEGLPRLIEDLGIERGLALFQQKSQSLLEMLRVLAGVTSPVIGQQTVSQGTGTSTASKGLLPAIYNPAPR